MELPDFMQLNDATRKVQHREHLTCDEARGVMETLLSGTTTDDHIVAFLVALREKGETPTELVGFAEVMRQRAAELLCRAGVNLEELAQGEPLLDTCGTGGDGQGTLNISTGAALVAAGAGVRVAKHGNRSISSRCGSADVLEVLGVSIDLPLEEIPACVEEVGMVFLFAPRVHVAMKNVMNARRMLKTKTVFNLLGPLTNPLGASVQLMGVYHHSRTEMMATTLQTLGLRRALVVASLDGLDEISTSGPTRLSVTEAGQINSREICPEEFGVPRARLEDFKGGDPEANARILRGVLEGGKGPHRDIILANAAAALFTAGMASDFTEGMERARESLDSGLALRKLRTLAEFTRKRTA